MLTQRFASTDLRRETAFFLSYSTMNIGFCMGFIASGFFDFSNQYQTLFNIGIILNVISLLLTFFSWKKLADINTVLTLIKPKRNLIINYFIGLISIVLLTSLITVCFSFSQAGNIAIILISILVFFIIFYLSTQQKIPADSQKMKAYLLLAVTSLIFWMIYYTGPMGVTIFIKNNVDKHLFDWEVATQWVLNVNALVIITGAPLLSLIITKLRLKGFTISIPLQFVTAFGMLGLSFLVLACGILLANKHGYTSIFWVTIHFIFQGIAELLIAPVGFSMIGKIVPVQLQGFLMGTWMMVSGVSASFSHYLSNSMVKISSSNPLFTNNDYYLVFQQLSVWAFCGAIFLYFFTKKLLKYMDNDEKTQKFSELLPLVN